MLKECFRGAIAAYSKHLKNEKLLIAVSGGSDSMALLHLCNAIPHLNFEVATVDHGLRPEANDEARSVGEHCATLNVKHTTLTWRPGGATAQSARLARYSLLARHAQSISAGGIVLGHTLDDQAETLLMRAKRLKDDSSTRGLSGMPEIASYGDIKLLRPLLNVRREELRVYLRHQDLAWIDDPSNDKLKFERVRVRKALLNEQTLPSTARLLPSIDQIGRFAKLSGRHRQWLAPHISEIIGKRVTFDGYKLSLAHGKNIPYPVITEIFLLLILASGGREFRVSDRKVEDIVEAFQSKKKLRKAVGNCLISVSDRGALFSKEIRKKTIFQSFKENTDQNFLSDENSTSGACPAFARALEYFRPTSDDSIHEAILCIRQHSER